MRHFSRLLAGAAAVALIATQAPAFDTAARAAFVLDQTTGTVLLAKNADEALPPASMSKLMTLYITFEAIRDGRLQLDERLPVSEHAQSYGGSTMFLDTTDRVRVEDLLRGIIVLSGNDACAVLAEALSPDGTEAGFARLMTQRAPAAWHDLLDLQERLGLARRWPRHVGARPHASGQPHHHRFPGFLPDVRGAEVRVRRPRALERQQPQPASGSGDRRRRLEERPYRRGRLWPCGVGDEWRTPGDLHHHRAAFERRARRAVRADRQLGLPPIRREDHRDKGTRPSPAPMSGWVPRKPWNWCPRKT